MYNIKEEIIQTQKTYFFHKWINKPFSEENKVNRTQFEARKAKSE